MRDARRIARTDDPEHLSLIAWMREAGSEARSIARVLTRSRHDRARAWGAEAMGQAPGGDRRDARHVASLHRDRSSRVRACVAASLGVLAGRGVRVPSRPLVRLARDRHPVVRARAAFALGSIADRAATRALVRLARDPVAEVRSWAAFGLSCRPHHAHRAALLALGPLLRDRDPEVQEEAMIGLARAGDERAAALLVALLDAHEPSPLMLEAFEERPTPEVERALRRWRGLAEVRGDGALAARIARALDGR